MTTYCCGVGALAKLGIGPKGGTVTRMDFIDFKPTKIVKTISDAGEHAIRGTLDPINTDVGEGIQFVQFRTRFYLTSAKWVLLMPLLGFDNGGSGDLWTLKDSLTESTIIVGNANADEHTYDGCVPTDWAVVGQKGTDPVHVDIGWIGKTFATAANGTFFTSQTSPAMTEGIIYPYATGVNNTTTFTVNGGTTVSMPQIKLAMDYKIVDEFLSSVTATNLCPTAHKLTIASSALYSTCDGTTALFTTPQAGTITGGAVVVGFSTTLNSGNTTTFTVANAKFVSRPPHITKNEFERLPINMVGYATSGAALLTCNNIVAGV